jgi:hypothetical protein
VNLGEAWERIGIRPRRLVVFAVVLVVVFVAWPLARDSGMLDSLLGITCHKAEAEVLKEFPQYGGRVVGEDLGDPLGQINPFAIEGLPPGCSFPLTLPHATPKQVGAYYEEQLTEHGWKVKRFFGRDTSVEGVRDGYRYEVVYWPSGHGPASHRSLDSAGRSKAVHKEGTAAYVMVYREDTDR